LALAAVEACDLDLVIAANTEVRGFRRNNLLGINGKQEFSWADSRLKRYAVFDHVDEHPMLSLRTINGPQRGIYRIWCRHRVPSLMEEGCMTAPEFFEELGQASFESMGFRIQEVRSALVNYGEPRLVILIGVADVNMPLGNELLHRSYDFLAVFVCESLLRCVLCCGHWPVPSVRCH
jgi:hypothetical protein